MKHEHPERVTETHAFFWNSVFSNWYPAEFVWNGLRFENSETALMWAKATVFNDRDSASAILTSQAPPIVKALGREVKNYDGNLWDGIRLPIMESILEAKFQQNMDMLEILAMYADNKVIVEASPHDRIWGIGLHWSDDRVLDESKWDGDNLLGKALMLTWQKIVECS